MDWPHRLHFSLPALLLGVAACATPEPEPCTADWVAWKKDQVFSEFTANYRSDIRALRNLEDDLSNPSMIAAIRLASRLETIGQMAEEFVDVTVPEIQATLSPCLDSPVQASDLMADMLRDQGVDEEVVKWVQALGAFVDTAASPTGDADS